MEPKDELQCCVTTCGLPLNANYWDQQYQNNETGWDMNQVSPPVKNYIDTLSGKAIKILIPGCGNAYEAEYLMENGFTNVTLIDIAGTLVNSLREKFSGKPIRILHQDFFEHNEKYDLILEQTFFCAINPSLRERYAAKCFHLLNGGGKIAGLLFNIEFERDGPPFGGKREDYQILFEPMFHLEQFDKCETSIPKRQGNELFVEMKKKNMSADWVKLYRTTGITCSGCKRTVTQKLLKTEGVKSVSINSDFSELLVVSNQPAPLEVLRNALADDTNYQLNETFI
ncbi:MAG: methyltransferase domain-containing protein [Bacteroidetes bacterium]|nr:methyltransferase domain-containing protein [Bacteroidota bacterium]